MFQIMEMVVVTAALQQQQQQLQQLQQLQKFQVTQETVQEKQLQHQNQVVLEHQKITQVFHLLVRLQA